MVRTTDRQTSVLRAIDWWTVAIYIALLIFGWVSVCGASYTYGDTDIFITPGYRFRVIDRLITNFHLPKSTLLMLVSAFSSMEHIRSVYRHAVEHEYRFFSYGDAMVLGRRETDIED